MICSRRTAGTLSRYICGLAAAAAVTCAFPAPAKAQQAFCPSDQELLSLSAPSWIYTSELIVVDYTANGEADRVSDPAITVGSAAGETTITQPAVADSGQFGVMAPSSAGAGHVTVSWTQDANTVLSCRASHVFEVDVLAKGTKVGDPDLSRLSGRFKVRFDPVNYSAPPSYHPPATWSFSSVCDVYGCDARLHGSGGAEGLLRLDGDRWMLTTPWRVDNSLYCQVHRNDPITHRAFDIRVVRIVIVERASEGRVTRFSGTSTIQARVNRRGRRAGCTHGRSYRDRISGRLKT